MNHRLTTTEGSIDFILLYYDLMEYAIKPLGFYFVYQVYALQTIIQSAQLRDVKYHMREFQCLAP